jgi:hypothetical protein
MQFRTLSSSVWVVVCGLGSLGLGDWWWPLALWFGDVLGLVFTIFAFLPDSPSLALFGYPQAAPLPLHPLNPRILVVTIVVGGLEGGYAWHVSLGVEKGATRGPDS